MTPDLSYYWEGAREWWEDNNWDGEKQMLQRYVITTHSIPTLLRDFLVFCLSILLYAKIIYRLHSSFWCSNTS